MGDGLTMHRHYANISISLSERTCYVVAAVAIVVNVLIIACSYMGNAKDGARVEVDACGAVQP